jgi:hypothetical protein
MLYKLFITLLLRIEAEILVLSIKRTNNINRMIRVNNRLDQIIERVESFWGKNKN